MVELLNNKLINILIKFGNILIIVFQSFSLLINKLKFNIDSIFRTQSNRVNYR